MAQESSLVPLHKAWQEAGKSLNQSPFSFSPHSLTSQHSDAARQGTQAGKGRIFQQRGKGMELEEAKKILGIEAVKAPTYDSIMEV